MKNLYFVRLTSYKLIPTQNILQYPSHSFTLKQKPEVIFDINEFYFLLEIRCRINYQIIL